MHFDDPLGNCEPQPGAAFLLRDRGVGLLEFFEDLRLVLLGDAWTVSCTATVKLPSATEVRMPTSPVSVNLMAFPTRLNKT